MRSLSAVQLKMAKRQGSWTGDEPGQSGGYPTEGIDGSDLIPNG
jgi:hypothetical protein